MSQEQVKTGYLTKSPPQASTSISFKNWRRRWFVLLDSSRAFPLAPRQVRLEYYTDETSASQCEKPKGVIDLRECSGVIPAKEIRGHKNVFNVVTKRRCYHLSADNVADKDKWVFELQRIVNDCKSPQRHGMATSQFGQSADDAVLATPKLIPPQPYVSGSDKQMRRTKSNDVPLHQPTSSAVYTVPASMTYDEDWDSDDESVGPASVQSVSALSDDRAFTSKSPTSRSAPHQTFGRHTSPQFSGLVAEPLHFGTGEFDRDTDDGVPDYKNLPDEYGPDDHDYYDYHGDDGGSHSSGNSSTGDHYGRQVLDETEDGIADYDVPDETEDGVLDYANLDSQGQHMKDTDDGIFDYADVQFDASSTEGKHRSMSAIPDGDPFAAGATLAGTVPHNPYMNLKTIESLNLMSTGGQQSVRGGAAARGSIRQQTQATYDDPLTNFKLPGSIRSFGDKPNGSSGSPPLSGKYRNTPSLPAHGGSSKAKAHGYMNLPPVTSTKPNVRPSAKPAGPRKLSGTKSASSVATDGASRKPPPASGRPRPSPPGTSSKPAAPPRPGHHRVHT